MQKLNIAPQTRFSEIELEQFNAYKFSIYFLDTNWNYLFINSHGQHNLGARGESIIGKNMWQHFSELTKDPSFSKMKHDTENGTSVNFITTSPITGQRLNIVGYPLQDCYFFYASQLPNKEALMNELRESMDKK